MTGLDTEAIALSGFFVLVVIAGVAVLVPARRTSMEAEAPASKTSLPGSGTTMER
jgi:hypothetical protein